MSTHSAARPYPAWFSELSQYTKSHTGKAVWQLLNTIIPYLVLWIGMIFLMLNNYSYWITLALTIPAGGLLVRIFIFFHDCCHGSFFPSRRANKLVGYITGMLTFTPFDEWRRLHNIHHATSGDLDRRGIGDIWTMTVKEYRNAGAGKRFLYRLARNPIIMLGLGPVFLFLYSNRFAHPDSKKEEKRSVLLTNIILLLYIIGLSWLIGLKVFLMIQLPILLIAGAIGIWLFYVQHQFEDAYWTNNEEWDLMQSALNGSSFYKLPAVLQWVTGNIGYHHIHHLRPRIPNYNLQSCNENIAALKQVPPLTLGRSLRSVGLHLWDEEKQKLVGFRSAKNEV